MIPIQENSGELGVDVITFTKTQHWNIRLFRDNMTNLFPLTLESGMRVEIYGAPPQDSPCWDAFDLVDYYTIPSDYYRPRYHYTPPYGWMNDPNGLFYYNGVFNLYYQYNPWAAVWGNMTWGHASTIDFFQWAQHPWALTPDDLGTMFSGSAVVDSQNDSGYGVDTIVAMYACDDPRNGFERQCVAFSADLGVHFDKYKGNPVIPNEAGDFRDPKMLRYNDHWIAIVSDVVSLRFYSSTNFTDWTYESNWGAEYGTHAGGWECPDMFPLDGKWVIVTSVNPNVQYFVGMFDGHTFQCDSPPNKVKYMDFGMDYYAAQTFSNTGDRRIGLAWMMNWNYAQNVPTYQYRSLMTIPREMHLALRDDGERYLAITALPEFEARFTVDVGGLTEYCKVDVDLVGVTASVVHISFANSGGEVLHTWIDRTEGRFYLDRTEQTGIWDFSGSFPRTLSCDLPRADEYHLKYFIDVTSVEVFEGSGYFAMSNLVFPRAPYEKVVITGENGDALSSVGIHSAWILQ
jgi:levanase/fructan beta-fructosidase